jgi:hypothetical protein
MNIIYDGIADRAFLKDAAQKREGEIRQVFGTDPVDVSWVLRSEEAPRELLLVAKAQERQAEEAISSSELYTGNGPFTEKLTRMKDALAHNGEWRAGVHDFMNKACQWCNSLPGTTIEDDTVTLNEERSGRYTLPALRVKRNGRTLRIQPIAGWVIPPTWFDQDPKAGNEEAIGRVDLDGSFGPIHLYLLSPSNRWIYQSRVLDPNSPPTLFGIVDQATFLRLVAECMDD